MLMWKVSLAHSKKNIYRHKVDCQKEMQAQLFKYIEVWYNRQRIHSSLGYQTPLQCRESYYSSKRVSRQKQKELHPLDNRVEQVVSSDQQLTPAF